MLFNSYIFIFVFLPIALIGYYFLGHRKQNTLANVFLTLMSLLFYAYFNLSYLPIILSSIFINYVIYQLMKRFDHKKAILVVGLLFNLGLLGYYKYFDFFIENINTLFQADFLLRNILLPLGISFFTFQQISFLIDSYRGIVKDCRITEYALFVTFFPQLVAGPIVSYEEMIPQFGNVSTKQWKRENMEKGLFVFVIGLFKKVLIADVFGNAVNWGYANIPDLDTGNILLVILFFSIQLYFDFSGYCDMARGLGKMFGITIPLNFDSPYQATNQLQFWRRWHITLNRFMMNYLYIPLGGSKKGKLRTYLNIFLIFLVSGIWHGAAWTFVVWGALHGLAAIFTKRFLPWIEKIPGKITMLATYLFFSFTLIFFRADDIKQVSFVIAKLGQGTFGAINENIVNCFLLHEFWYPLKMIGLANYSFARYLPMIGMAIGAYLILFLGKNTKQMEERNILHVKNAVCISILFVWSIISLAQVSTFLYFNF